MSGPNINVRLLGLTDKGVHCYSTASSSAEAFWLPKKPCIWDQEPHTAGQCVSVQVSNWLASRHRQIVGDEAFEKVKKERKSPMSNNTDYPPSFRLASLYRKKSQQGATYFSGRLGGAKVVLLKSKETADDGAEIWNLLISEAPQKQDARPAPRENSQRDFARPNNGGSPGAF